LEDAASDARGYLQATAPRSFLDAERVTLSARQLL